jgi:hypothetical protein
VSGPARLGEPAGVERRIHQRTCELAFIDVEGANGHRPGRHPLRHLPVLVILLVLSRHVRRAAGEQELGSVEPDPLGARGKRRCHVLGALDVGLQ